ncbi:MAG: class I SAM-dependent methyltransferase [Haloferacaceae archaeon]
MDDSERKTATAASFGASAEGYRDSATHRAGEDLDRLASWCGDASRALDVATGAGHTAGALRDAGVARVVAADAAPAMLATARETVSGLDVVAGDAERLPFAAGAFDAVTCRIAAHHFPAPEAFVADVARVLRPGGTVALEDNVAPPDDALAQFRNRLERARDPTHVESYRTATWHDWLRNAGFDVAETDHVVRRIEVGPWIDRIDSSEAADEGEIRRALDAAPDHIAEAFGIEYDDGAAVAFGSRKALIRAELRE